MKACEQEISLLFVDGNHAPLKSGKGFYRSLHTSNGNVVGACNHAVPLPNVWVGVASLIALIVLMVDSPKGRGKLIPLAASGGPGFKFLWICQRSQPVDKGFGSALDMALQSSFVLFSGSSAFPIVDLTFHGQWHIFRFRCQAPCSGKFACVGNHLSLATHKIFTVEVVKARYQKTLQQRQL